MPLTAEQFEQRMQMIGHALHEEHDTARTWCIALHKDLGLGATLPEQDVLEEMASRLDTTVEEMLSETDGEVDASIEHAQLHRWLEGLPMAAAAAGTGGAQLVAMLMLAGKRLGQIEAAQALSFGEESGDDPR